MERKSSKEYSVVFLVDGKKFKLLNLHDDFIFVVGSAASSVGATLVFAVFRIGPDPNYSKASAFWFFLSTTMVFAAVRTHFPRKTQACFVDRAAINKQQFEYKMYPFGPLGFKSVREKSFFFHSFSFLFFLFFFSIFTLNNKVPVIKRKKVDSAFRLG